MKSRKVVLVLRESQHELAAELGAIAVRATPVSHQVLVQEEDAAHHGVRRPRFFHPALARANVVPEDGEASHGPPRETGLKHEA